jgi:hypothetical protein
LKENPTGRLLFAGSGDYSSLYGYDLLGSVGRFLGVRSEKVAEGGSQKIKAPSLNDILKYSRNFVPKVAQSDFEQGLRQFYK